MADYASIGEKFGIVYTCNCAWLLECRELGYEYPVPGRTARTTTSTGTASLKLDSDPLGSPVP